MGPMQTKGHNMDGIKWYVVVRDVFKRRRELVSSFHSDLLSRMRYLFLVLCRLQRGSHSLCNTISIRNSRTIGQLLSLVRWLLVCSDVKVDEETQITCQERASEHRSRLSACTGAQGWELVEEVRRDKI